MELLTLQAYENAVITIMRRLPDERQRELVDFAQFLEFQVAKLRAEPHDAPRKTDISEDDAKWERLLATTESTRVLEKMAREAREEYHAGNTTPILITDDGRLSPE